MKKLLNYVLFALLIVPFVLTSCTEDEEPTLNGPTISVGGEDVNETTFEVGDDVDLTIDFTAEAEFSGFNYEIVLDEGEENEEALPKEYNTPASLGLSNNEVTGSFDFTWEVTAQMEGRSVTIHMEVVDKENEIATETFSFDVPVAGTITSYTAILLYAPTAEENSQTLFSTDDGERYSVNDVEGTEGLSSAIDFGYYYGVTDQASLASPAAYPANIYDISDWNTRHETQLRLTDISESEFQENEDNVTFVRNAFDEAEGDDNDGIVTGLNAGDIVAFQLDESKDSRRGLIRVLSLEPGSDSNDYIEIEVLVID